MKCTFFLFWGVVYAVTLHAQTATLIQTGLVREQNSNKKPVADAQIVFSDAVPATSDQSGKFRLAFSAKKPGDLIFYQEITKKGYEIVNEKELQILKIGNSENLGKDIILAKAGVLDAAKKEYYDISDKALLASFNKEKNALQTKLKAAQLTQENYLDKFNALSEQYEQQQKALDALADVFARTNFDDVSAEYKQSFELFEGGKIDEALKILEGIDLIGRTKSRLNEKRRIENAATLIAAQKVENEREIQGDLQGLQLQAQLYVLTFQVEKAERLYDQVLRLDSTDLDILSSVADFYRENHRYDKALRVLPLIIAHPKAEEWQKANSYSYMGDVYTAIGQLEFAINAYIADQKACIQILEANPGSPIFKSNLAVAYERLGKTYAETGALDKSLNFYEKEIQSLEELYAAYPYNIDFKKGLGISFIKLGDTYASLSNLDKTLTSFTDAVNLFKELYAIYPQNVVIKKGMAVSYSKLGEVHTTLGHLDIALKYYEKFFKITNELNTENPSDVDIKKNLAISYSKLGETYTALGNLDKALTFFEPFAKVMKELQDTYPQNVEFKKGLAIAYEKVGDTYQKIGNLEKALTFFQDEVRIFEALHVAYPQNVHFKSGLAVSYQFLGNTYSSSGDFGRALICYEQYNFLQEALCEIDPRNMDFKKSLAISYEKLGKIHFLLKNISQALVFYQKYQQLSNELYTDYPLNMEFKRGLAVSYSKLGEVHFALGNQVDALVFFEKDIELSKEILEADPKNVDYKFGVAIAYIKLASICINKDVLKAKGYLKKAQKLLTELSDVSPQNAEIKKYLNIVQGVLDGLPIENDNNDPVVTLINQIQNEPDITSKYRLYCTLCDTLRFRAGNDSQQKYALVKALNESAWFGIFLKKFEAAENHIREAMALQKDYKYLQTNLALALLLQGKYKQAHLEYNKWKNEPYNEQNQPTYREAFLDDLNTLEKAGIIPEERKADVAAIRKLLSEK